MKYQLKGFTLIELSISVLILSIIILGISISMIQVSKNFHESQIKTDIFLKINELYYDTSLFSYNSGNVYTGWLLLYNDKKWLLLWGFQDKNDGYNYEFSYDKNTYQKSYLWYFLLDEMMLSGVLNDSTFLSWLLLNRGKIYDKLIIKDLSFILYNTGQLFEMQTEIFKKYDDTFSSTLKDDILIPVDNYIKFNFHY